MCKNLEKREEWMFRVRMLLNICLSVITNDNENVIHYWYALEKVKEADLVPPTDLLERIIKCLEYVFDKNGEDCFVVQDFLCNFSKKHNLFAAHEFADGQSRV